jgi:hypothetical protein
MKGKHLNPQAVAAANFKRLIVAAESLPLEKCIRCGCLDFLRATRVKIVPGVAIGELEPQTINFEVYVCVECHTAWGPHVKKEKET